MGQVKCAKILVEDILVQKGAQILSNMLNYSLSPNYNFELKLLMYLYS